MRKLWTWMGLLGLVAGGTACGTRESAVSAVSTEEASNLLKDPRTFLLDVRTPDEYAAERLAGALLIPVAILGSQGDRLPADRDRPILIYCRSGNRSAQAAAVLAQQGHRRLYSMRGGINAWSAEGRPVEAGPPR